MNTHNIYFHIEVRKILYGYSLLPGAVNSTFYSYLYSLGTLVFITFQKSVALFTLNIQTDSPE